MMGKTKERKATAKREIGTQTSVVHTLEPGLITAAAHRAPCSIYRSYIIIELARVEPFSPPIIGFLLSHLRPKLADLKHTHADR